jgi:Ca2+-binding RTX toxin-like protein
MPIQFLDSGGESIVLTGAQPHQIDLSKPLVLSQQSTVEIFTSAQFAGVQFWAVDPTNAQGFQMGIPFSGVNLTPNGQFGLTTVTLGAGTWYFGAMDNAVPAGVSVGAFVDASVVSSSGTPAGNVPMAIYANPGAWRAIGFDVTGAPQSFLQSEAVGGKVVVMTEAQFQTFQAQYAAGYNGGGFASVAPIDGTIPAGGSHGELTLAPGSYELVFINDTAGWSGGAANLSFFSGGGGGTGSIALNGHSALVNKDLPTTGNDDLLANGAFSEVHAGAGDDTINGAATNDYLRGDDGDDSISGGAQFDDINGNMGNDTLHGNAGDDWVVGGKNDDLQFGDAGNDIVWGNLGNDTLNGGDGDDQVRGGQGNDILDGGAGNDFVSGDRGNDTITGGAGADLFHTFSGAGIDKVLDFHLSEGDRVMLDPGTTFTVNQVGADTVIDMGNGDEMILVGVQKSTLVGDWIFTGP